MKKLKSLSIMLSFTCMILAFCILSPTSVKAATKTINAQWSVYPNTSAITFNFTGANPSNHDWIGIYKNGTVPGKTPALAWTYAKTANGSYTFYPNDFIENSDSPQRGLHLARGKYKAYLCDNNGYSYTCNPYTFWIDGDDPVCSFDVLSDLHANGSNTYNATNKIAAAFNDLLQYSPLSNGIMLNGDSVDHYKSYSALNQALNDINISKAAGIIPKMYFNLGNHELYTDTSQKNTQSFSTKTDAFVNGIAGLNFNKGKNMTYKNFGSKTYFQFELNNCAFIFVAPTDYHSNSNDNALISDKIISDVNSAVYKIAKYSPNKPIFVFIHQPFQNTVTSSSSISMDNDSSLRWYLNKYPTVTVFTSHTHEDLNSSSWVYQEKKASSGSGVGMTIFNTSSVSDLYKNGVNCGNGSGSQGLHVDVYNDSIVVRARDFANKKWIKEYKIDLNAKRNSLASSSIG